MKRGIIVELKEEMHDEIKTLKDDLATVSKAFHELKSEKDNVKIRSRNIIIVILLFLLIGSNLCWLIYRTSLEKVVKTTTETYTIEGVEQNAEGSNYIVGGDMNGYAENKEN